MLGICVVLFNAVSFMGIKLIGDSTNINGKLLWGIGFPLVMLINWWLFLRRTSPYYLFKSDKNDK